MVDIVQPGVYLTFDDPNNPGIAFLSYKLWTDTYSTTEIIVHTGAIKKAENWIGIAPFAQYESKVYPKDLMQQVIDDLAKNTSNKIFLFGGGSEEIKQLNQLKNNHQNVLVLAGKINLKAELAIISNLNLNAK